MKAKLTRKKNLTWNTNQIVVWNSELTLTKNDTLNEEDVFRWGATFESKIVK